MPGAEARYGLFDQVRLFHGDGAQDNAFYTCGKGLLDVSYRAHAAAELYLRAAGSDLRQYLPVGAAGFCKGAVQIDDVQPDCAIRDPALSAGHGIMIKHRLPVGIAQLQAYYLPVA
jgi:hypothetical protein